MGKAMMLRIQPYAQKGCTFIILRKLNFWYCHMSSLIALIIGHTEGKWEPKYHAVTLRPFCILKLLWEKTELKWSTMSNAKFQLERICFHLLLFWKKALISLSCLLTERLFWKLKHCHKKEKRLQLATVIWFKSTHQYFTTLCLKTMFAHKTNTQRWAHIAQFSNSTVRT